MSRLFIFGNGFDRHFGLNTCPSDYLQFLKNEAIYNEIENAVDVFAGYNVLWSNFEEDISYIDLDEIEEQQLGYPDYLSDHESDRDGCILNMEMYVDSLYAAINNSLLKMVDAAEYQLDLMGKDDSISFKKEDSILTFNYTTTAEKLFDIPNTVLIEHIHGCRIKQEKLILGYCESNSNYDNNRYSNSEDGDFYLERQAGVIFDFYSSLKKIHQIDRLNIFLDKLKNVDEVFVYGHSLGCVDIPYFEIIETTINPCKWNVSQFNNDQEIILNARNLSFANKINFFPW